MMTLQPGMFAAESERAPSHGHAMAVASESGIHRTMRLSFVSATLVLFAFSVTAHAEEPQDASAIETPEECEAARPTEAELRAVPERPAAIVTGAVGAYAGGGQNGGFGRMDASDASSTALGYGFSGAARVDAAVLSPLWVAASARVVAGSGARSYDLDAVAGFDFRRFGHRWVDAGYSVVGRGRNAIVSTWDSHCQMRRDDLTIIGGVKGLVFDAKPATKDAIPNAFAVQLGVQEWFERDGAKTFWSASALYDAVHHGYGAEYTIWAPLLAPYVFFGTHGMAMTSDEGFMGMFTLEAGTTIGF